MPLHFMAGTAQSEISLAWFVALAVPAAVVFAWIFNATGGSVPAVVAAHVGFNLGVGPKRSLALPGDATVFALLCAVPTVLLPAGLIAGTGARLGLPEDEARGSGA